MDTDDLEPIQKPVQKIDLEIMSVEDLNEYIDGLKAEIVRAEAAIALKGDARSEAEKFFK